MSSLTRYAPSQIALHWVIAVLIAINWFLGDAMGHAFRDVMRGRATELTLSANAHRVVGIAVLVLVAVRLVLRQRKGAPDPTLAGPTLQQMAAKYGHWALYALMVIVPLTGVAAYNSRLDWVGEVHTTAMNILLIAALGHAGMAFYHHYVLKDGTLRKMI